MPDTQGGRDSLCESRPLPDTQGGRDSCLIHKGDVIHRDMPDTHVGRDSQRYTGVFACIGRIGHNSEISGT